MRVTYFNTAFPKGGDKGTVCELDELLLNAEHLKSGEKISIQPFGAGIRLTTEHKELINDDNFDKLFILDIDAVGGIHKIDGKYSAEALKLNKANSLKIIQGMQSEDFGFCFENVIYATLSKSYNLHLFCKIPNFSGGFDFENRYRAAALKLGQFITSRLNECHFIENEIEADAALSNVHQLTYVVGSKLYKITDENEATPIDEDILYHGVYEQRIGTSCLTEIDVDVDILEGDEKKFDLSSDAKLPGYKYSGHNARWRICNMLYLLYKNDYEQSLNFIKRHFPTKLKEMKSILGSTSRKNEIRLDCATLKFLINEFIEFENYKDWFKSYSKQVKEETKMLKQELKKEVEPEKLLGVSEYTETSSKYVSDVIDLFVETNSNSNLQFIAKCGMGKTFAIKKELMKNNNVLVVNFLNSLNISGYRDFYKRGIKSAESITGDESVAINVANLEYVPKVAIDKFNYVVIDEIQKFFQDDDYREIYSHNIKLINQLVKENKLILLTGTPWNFDKMGKFKSLLINKSYDFIEY